jgi:ubiquinone/menaquinone biosynthesis C-methylase UbiE
MHATNAYSREREVLLLALRSNIDASMHTELARLLEQGIDWTVLVRTAMAHRLVPLLENGITPLGAPLVPRDITQAFASWSDRNLQHWQVCERGVTELARSLRAQQINALFLHGPAVALAVYGELRLQEATTPAVLLREVDLKAVDATLRSLGYQLNPSAPEPVASTRATPRRLYLRREDQSAIEVGTSILDEFQGITLDADTVEGRAVSIDVLDEPLSVLSPGDLALILCADAGMRDWQVTAELCDLAWLLRGLSAADLVDLRARAGDQRIQRLLELGLGLARAVFGVPDEPARQVDTRLDRAVSRYSSRLLADPGDEPVHRGFSLDQLMLRERRTQQARYVAQHLALPFRRLFSRTNPSTARDAAVSATERNRVHWGRRSEAWEKWSVVTRPRSAEFSRALISAAAAKKGGRVLDLACGVGDTSLELGELIGGDGLVVTTDLAFDMVERARHRAVEEGLGNLRFAATAMQYLPFRGRSFDAVVCRLGIMYCPDVPLALSEARRVLKPGTRAAFLVCGPREANPVLDVVHRVVTEFFELRETDDAIDPFRFSASGSLADGMRRAGFLDVAEEDVTLHQRAPVGTPFWQASLERGLSLTLEQLPDDTRAELVRRMTEAFEPYRQDGFYMLPNLSRITSGRCPAQRA